MTLAVIIIISVVLESVYSSRSSFLVKEGFDNELVFQVSSSINIPVIASGGVGSLQHLIDGIQIGGAEAVLAASIFHFSEFTIQEAKDAMKDSGIVVRA